MKRHQLVVRRRSEPAARVHDDEAATCTTRQGARYAECRKNHVASTGGYATDGCGEFMADGEEGTTGALKCAACGCHRSFHRRVQEAQVEA
ncbi:hypothetical protein Cni_G24287 [Canna indica]|uniref:ZF-HD dimerization-type domain-containing protein n=1 Tax=Canna indica TaxID=4628 RepID=A0AAQ3KZW5_9LILI|nr:hypothetical protein Cni_G24287 [Canna indica]